MSDLPVIEFDGKSVKPSNGKYKCPFRCHTSGYPAPTWKTEAGFHKHMKNCPCSPTAQARKAEESAQRAAEAARAGAEAAAGLGLAIGDEVCYVGYRVTAPTHVMRGDRQVRVRYEELRAYFGAKAKIESFSWNGALVLNGHILATNVCPSLAAAREKADQLQLDYQAHLDFSASVR